MQGAFILDMRPQNIYFDPASAAITVIDIGGITEATAIRRQQDVKLDLHDFLPRAFQMVYPAFRDRPPNPNGYRQPIGMETVPMFNQNLDSMIRQAFGIGKKSRGILARNRHPAQSQEAAHTPTSKYSRATSRHV